MMNDKLIARHRLDNGLELLFCEQGNRYFGDYHQVKVVVICRVPVDESMQSEHLSLPDLQKAKQLFGDQVEYRRELRQMAVAGDDVETVRDDLVRNFIANSGAYMQAAGFASRFIARKLKEHRNRSRLHLFKP